MLKIFGLLILLGLAFIIAGLTGLLFWVWPTSWPDQSLTVSVQQLGQLQKLRDEPKFVEDLSIFYPGAETELGRIEAEVKVNALLDTLMLELRSHASKAYVLSRFKLLLATCRNFDSEDRDRLLRYLEQVMTIVGIETSNELFNVWRYGLPYGWLPTGGK